MNDWLEFEIADGIGLLRLNRPPANVMDLAFLNGLADRFEALAGDAALQVLVVTGQGGVFSAGLDLKTVPFLDAEEQKPMIAAINRAFGRLYCFPRPTIAAINGHAIAGGMVLALCCDYRIACDDKCQMGLAEVRVGVPYPIAAMEAAASELPRQAGRQMIMFGRDIGPQAALDWGAVDQLTPAGELEDAAMNKARELAQIPRNTYEKVKRQYRRAAMRRIEDVIANQNDPLREDWLSAETTEAARAMLDGLR